MLYLLIERFGFLFSKEKRVLPVHSMFDDEVEESEGSDERTDDRVGDSKSEHQQHPGVVNSEGELVEDGSSNGGYLRFRLGAAQSQGVHEELRKPHDLQAGPHQRASCHVVNEEGSVVWQEDALPVGVIVFRISS